MTLPFNVEQFFDVFGRYNLAVWPAQLVLYAIALLIVANLILRVHFRFNWILLGALWIWAGLVYHLTFFADINPVAPAFAALWILQGALLWWRGWTPGVRAPISSRFGAWAGKVLVAYALVGYPLIGYLAGHRYPDTPTFGAPCPSTIFTLGVLLWSRESQPWWIVAIPIVWAVIGTSAAIQLSVPQDYGLFISAALSLLLLGRAAPSRVGPTPSASATRLT